MQFSAGIITVIVVVVLIVALLIFLSSIYKKTSASEVGVVTGAFMFGPYVIQDPLTHTKVKVVRGGGTLVIPIFQQFRRYSLDTFNIDVSVEDIMTKTYVPVDIDANAVLRPSSNPKLLAIAAEKLFGLSDEERFNQMKQVVLGGVRDAVSSLTPEEAKDRSSFNEQVTQVIEPVFNKMGLEVTNFQITKLGDKNGYYEALSAPDVAQKNMEKSKAEAEADREAREARANNNLQAKNAELDVAKQIASKNKETEVAKAQYQAEINTQQAIADKAADIAAAEQQVIVEQKNADVNKQKQQATTIVQANADAQQMQIKAEANAKQMETMANANAKKKQIDAEADAGQIKVSSSAESEKRKQLADADAYTTSQTGKAEAEKIDKIGEANAKAQKAMQDALNSKQGQAAMQMAIIKMLPELIKASAESLTNTKNLTIFNGAEGASQMQGQAFAHTVKFIKDATGLDIVDNLNKQADGKREINGEIPVKTKVDKEDQIG